MNFNLFQLAAAACLSLNFLSAEEIILKENFDSDVLASGNAWSTTKGKAFVQGGALEIGASTQAVDGRSEVVLNLPASFKEAPAIIEFDLIVPNLKAPTSRFEVTLEDSAASDTYMVGLATDANYYGDKSGCADQGKTPEQYTVGKKGFALTPGATHLIRLALDPSSSIAMLDVDSDLILTNRTFQKFIQLKSVNRLHFEVTGAGKWAISKLLIRQ